MAHLKNNELWITEGMMNDGSWVALPYWGTSKTRRECMGDAFLYITQHEIEWAQGNRGLGFSRDVRFKKYVRKEGE